VNVSAKDLATGKEQQITITASSGLGKDEMEKMVKEAEKHADEDKKRRQEIELRNQAEHLVYTTEKMLNEHREKIPIADIKPIEDAIADAKKALESGDIGRIKQTVEALSIAAQRIGTAMYEQATKDKARAEDSGTREKAGGPGGPQEGEVVDAEFEDLGKKDK
jgi:molecular chaperone DnaK